MQMLVQQSQQLQQRVQQTAQIMGEMVRAAQTGFDGNERDKRGFDDQVFSKLDKIDGQNRKEWSLQFKIALKRANREAYCLFEKTESQPQGVDVEKIDIDDEFVGIGMDKWANEMYDAWSMLLKGDAFAIAQKVPDINGDESWRRVYQRYSPSTLASALTA